MGKRLNISYLLNKILGLFGDKLVSVILFGSFARKNHDENSDVDIMVVLDKDEEKNIRDLRKDYLLKFSRKLDLHIFSKREIVQNFDNFSPLFVTLLLGKKILFDKDMFFERLFRNFIRELKDEDIKYCEGGKIWEIRKIARNLEVLH